MGKKRIGVVSSSSRNSSVERQDEPYRLAHGLSLKIMELWRIDYYEYDAPVTRLLRSAVASRPPLLFFSAAARKMRIYTTYTYTYTRTYEYTDSRHRQQTR